MEKLEPLANGLRTDHPIPGLPFVDDSHLPLDDQDALEAIGRGRGSEGMWGRTDPIEQEGGWVAFTTDPKRRDLAWVIRRHPDHGRSVILYKDWDASSVYMDFWSRSLLFRRGGYWWDGRSWFRPRRIWDPVIEDYQARAVPAAVIVTAADMLATGGNAERGHVLDIGEFDVETDYAGTWLDDLAAWADQRDDGALSASVMSVSAPELAAEQLISVSGLAEVAGIAASTLRAYIARDEADVPAPQVVVAGRSMWARTVAEEWAEQRRSSDEGLSATLATGSLEKPPGTTALATRMTKVFVARLWESGWRKRWALRWRTQEAVEEVARGLSWDVASSISRIVPLGDFAFTIRKAVVDDFAEQHAVHPGELRYAITGQIARSLAWLISHDPSRGARVLQDIVGEAHQRIGMPVITSTGSLAGALHLDGDLDSESLNAYLERAFAPIHVTET